MHLTLQTFSVCIDEKEITFFVLLRRCAKKN